MTEAIQGSRRTGVEVIKVASCMLERIKQLGNTSKARMRRRVSSVAEGIEDVGFALSASGVGVCRADDLDSDGFVLLFVSSQVDDGVRTVAELA